MRGGGGRRLFLAHTIPTLRLPYDNKCISPSFVLGLHFYPLPSLAYISFRSCPILSFLFVFPTFKHLFNSLPFISSSLHLSPFHSIHSSLFTRLCSVLSPEHSSYSPSCLSRHSLHLPPLPPQLVIPCFPTLPLLPQQGLRHCDWPYRRPTTFTAGTPQPKHLHINVLKNVSAL